MDSFALPCEGKSATSKRTHTVAAFVSGSRIRYIQGGTLKIDRKHKLGPSSRRHTGVARFLRSARSMAASSSSSSPRRVALYRLVQLLHARHHEMLDVRREVWKEFRRLDVEKNEARHREGEIRGPLLLFNAGNDVRPVPSCERLSEPA